MQEAASEARRAAQSARELAELLDEYAGTLTLPGLQLTVEELHFAVMDKLRELREALAASDRSVVQSQKGKAAHATSFGVRLTIEEAL
jgi:hypothetical protein